MLIFLTLFLSSVSLTLFIYIQIGIELDKRHARKILKKVLDKHIGL